MNTPKITLSGHVRSQISKTGLRNLKIEAWDKDNTRDDLAGIAMTDAEGRFSITIDPKALGSGLFDRKPDIYFKVYAGDKLVHSTLAQVMENLSRDQTQIEILIPMENPNLTRPNVVEGIVTNLQTHALSGLVVKAFNRDMRSETLLGEATTDAQGRYRITYADLVPVATEKARADLSMQVYSPSGKEQLFVTALEDVLYNASEFETIDIVIAGQIPLESNEFDRNMEAIKGLIGQVRVQDLEEGGQNRDITFLSKETGISPYQLTHLVVAHRLAAQAGCEAGLFYALLRENTLLIKNFDKTYHVRLQIDLDTDLKSLLYDAALLGSKVLDEAIQRAVAKLIVPAHIHDRAGKCLIKLEGYHAEGQEYYAKEYPHKVLDMISRFVLTGKVAEMGQLLQDHKDDLKGFFQAIASEAFFSNAADGDKAHTYAHLAELLGLDNDLLIAIGKTQGISKIDDIRPLASLNTKAWRAVLTETASSLEIAGKAIDPELIDLHASALARRLEKEFPTTAFVAQLGRETTEAFPHQDLLAEFLVANPDFDLASGQVDAYLNAQEKAEAVREGEREREGKAEQVGEREREETREEVQTNLRGALKRVQRVFKLVPHYGKTKGLLGQGIHSAQGIMAAGIGRFVQSIAPAAGIDAVEAKAVFQQAEMANTAAMLIVGELQDSLQSLKVPALEMPNSAARLSAVTAEFPNLKSLFALSDVCACEHCRSVYSPAAYLVEILQFIEQRSVLDLTNNRLPGSAKAVLFGRRPDLGEIDLSCENANTPLPYIDLVCELLEEEVSPTPPIGFVGDLTTVPGSNTGKISLALYNWLRNAPFQLPVTTDAMLYASEDSVGVMPPYYLRDKLLVCKIEPDTGPNSWLLRRLRQTLTPAADLAAAPAYVNEGAYNLLRTNNFAFGLPFDLNHHEASAYFERFGIARADLMAQFQLIASPSHAAIAAERLGLTDQARDLIVTPRVLPSEQQQIWNTTSIDPVTELSAVDTFLTKTGLSYKALDLLLSLKWIDPLGLLYITHSDLSCDTSQKFILQLTNADLDKLHRFLRLQKKTGWKFEFINELIMQPRLGNGQLNGRCLVHASNLVQMTEASGIPLETLLGFYGEISHTELLNSETKPLYQTIFLNKGRNGMVNDRLLPANVAAGGLNPISIVKASIALCLKLKETELDVLITSLPNGQLNFSNLSMLLSASVLMQKLHLKAADFLILKSMIGIDYQLSPANTLAFFKAATEAQKFALKPADLKYGLWHDATDLTQRAIKDTKIEDILKALQKAYQAAYDTYRSAFDTTQTADEQKEAVKAALGQLSVLQVQDVATLVQFIDRNWKYDWTDAGFVIHHENTALAATQYFAHQNIAMPFAITPIVTAINNLEVAGLAVVAADANLATAQADLLTAIAGGNTATIAVAQAALAAQVIVTNVAHDDYEAARNALVAAYLNNVADYRYGQAQQQVLVDTVAARFKVSAETAGVVLTNGHLKFPVVVGDGLETILRTDNLIDRTNVPAQLPAVTVGAFATAANALRLVHQMVPVIASLKVDDETLAWLLRNGEALAWLELDRLPYGAMQAQGDFFKYADLKAMLDLARRFGPVANPADPEKPISFWGMMAQGLPNMVAPFVPLSPQQRADWLTQLAMLTGHELAAITAIDAHFGYSNPGWVAYKSSATWDKVLQCAEDLRLLGLALTEVTPLLAAELHSTDAARLRTALKVRYDDATWLDTLKEIMDVVRMQKRDALVAYLLATHPAIKDANALFDYFLVDVEMCSCMPSSRIVQAHGSIQLFVTRCLMGLEPAAAADLDHDPAWTQWKWMKNYRVWEANRKVFLYPENWIEAELRDDKSYLFLELENELQQNELNDYNSEQALIKYVEKLDQIAFLEVVATWYQTETRVMHVFARTKGGDPSIYYYRRFEQERAWTPWEKVELDITGNQLLAFMRNNRLCLAWTVFSEEPDPNPKAKLPNQTVTTPQDIDKPKRRLKMQIAVSEYANQQWQPKKVSMESIPTPTAYTTDTLPRDVYNMIYFEAADQIYLFSNTYRTLSPGASEQEFITICGVFNLAGCKGYPELATNFANWNADFLPDFRTTHLVSQRYVDQKNVDDLAVRDGVTYIFSADYWELLEKTPGIFRITYPHQVTSLDIGSLIFQFLMLHSNNQASPPRQVQARTQPVQAIRLSSIKIPRGTLLPYFFEDSQHGYVIIPGFYRIDEKEKPAVVVKRTASDMFQLLDQVTLLIAKLNAYGDRPTDDQLRELMRDKEAIAAEVRAILELKYGVQFKNFYHPLICWMRKKLFQKGIPELMKRETQLFDSGFDFVKYYGPDTQHVYPSYTYENTNGDKVLSYPIEDIDFTSDGSYSSYNWELFFHVPFLMATRLTQNQRFEESMAWFHYIFNPTGALPGSVPEKYWVTKPFFQTHAPDYFAQRIDSLLLDVSGPASQRKSDLEYAIRQWREKPFRPHVVARFRPVAYQKATLMKYIDNLTEWGDNLFRQDTMESIAQATQMYILADKLLGSKPRVIAPLVKPPFETYNQIAAKLDHFGNALIDIENLLPVFTGLPEQGAELPPPPVTLSMLYFCIPPNEKMNEYWDRIADRLFKIRHCQNIDGVERSLALFAPPIDPAALVRAAAAGLDISSVIAGMNAPLPFYRFNVLSQKANELANEVRSLGGALLGAIEKKDGEAMALLRSELEIKMLNAVTDMKTLQIKEAGEQIEVLKRTKRVTEERYNYYRDIERISGKEQLNLDKQASAHRLQTAAQGVKLAASLVALIPDIDLGASGFGGSPIAKFKFGGLNMAQATNAASDILSFLSMLASNEASRAATIGGYDRRFADWKLQERTGKLELASIDKQIVAAEIRKTIAETDLKNHKLSIENAQKTDAFMRSKFTNKELYDWMIGQISSVYFQSYKLAHEFAKKAERAYQHELGNGDTFIQFGYWDSRKKGLQSADRLIHDLKRMETSYLDKNKREYELTKHVSLAMLDPLALIQLRATGTCDFEIPEALFDMDHAGHYFRRLKAVSVTIPCIAGPYTSVSAKLSLVSNKYRKNPAVGAPYQEGPGNDPRFAYNIGAIQSIATSNAQNDSGMFELNFRDERYLPFEGAGAISTWRLELPAEVRQFDYLTISDVLMHLKYTAREGGSSLKGIANTELVGQLNLIRQRLSTEGLHHVIDLKHDMSNAWFMLKRDGQISVTIGRERLPYFVQGMDNLTIGEVLLVVKSSTAPAMNSYTVANTAVNVTQTQLDPLYHGVASGVVLGIPFDLVLLPAAQSDLEELLLVVQYTVGS